MSKAIATEPTANSTRVGVGRALWSSQASMDAVIDDRLVIERGRGAHVWDQEGRKLLDVGSSLWHANIGHGREELADAAREQMIRLETYHTFGRLANRRALELADR